MTVLEANITASVSATSAESHAPLFVFAGGGSGGHLYPALAIAEALRNELGAIRTVFFGTERPIDNRVLTHAGETLVPQNVRPVSSRPWRWPGFLRAWRASTTRCRAHFAAHRPAMVVGTGGFASAPAVRVAAKRGIPAALLNPDLVPGKANRFLTGSVEAIFAQFAETANHFPDGAPVEVTGCPVRSTFATASREQGIAEFDLDPQRKTLLVTGASLGARSINTAMVHLAPQLAARSGWQVLHLSGSDDANIVRSAYASAGVAAKVVEYTEQMACAMAAADLMITRAGASTIAEVLASAVPVILVPYPHHRDQHQLAHARLLARRGAAAFCTEGDDAGATASALAPILADLMADAARRMEMRRALADVRSPHAATTIARRMIELAGCRRAVVA
ncbi:MAG: UDP-N-acetylglucosamine--N-acetylmuramyl-(pentapeptide) pyrophosphoryl-undecaprenol N-acetylglucosamine transferase [Phycisphaerales bacterium]|nr:UDP-N-acetylglucosamine--N-acetylmuramyl-(pentapeptide) pyrophosphoryl-undecaprenol N-acetylglucosamine transferase [Phycisphaerales bacterium]